MCGIAGFIGLPGDRRDMAERMLDSLRHRGPDDEGIECPYPGVTLAHTRLSIIDLTPGGHQPMRDMPPPGLPPNWVVFNGEIFNYRELQPEVDAEGWRCRTASDTGVILHAYRVWGEAAVTRFRGMFAFCVIDTGRGHAWLSRDRLGIKPLYLCRPKQGGLIFASELRALLSLGSDWLSPRVNPASIESFFAQGAVQGYDTIVDGVTLLEPGTNLLVDLETGNEVHRRRYWELPAASRAGVDLSQRTREDAVGCLHALARDAVRLRLISDVPLGLFLSGGIDSAAMLSLATAGNSEVRTISLGFDVAVYDETADAEATAAVFKSNHTTLRITDADVVGALPSLLQSMDQPSVDGMNTFVVSRAARQAGLTVALSGLGGDELFGGYESFTGVPRAVRLRRQVGWTGLGTVVETVLRNRTGAKLNQMFHRAPDLLTMYLLRRELFLPHERRALIADVADDVDPTSGLTRRLLDDVCKRSQGLDDRNRVSFFELELYMRHMLLRDADAFSMASSLEYRVPFLDHLFVEGVFGVNGRFKARDPRPKPLLLDLVGGLPAAVWQKPKRGFTFPWGVWFTRGPLKAIGHEATHDTTLWNRLNVSPTAVAATWRQFVNGDTRISALQVLAFVALRDFAVRHQLRG